MTLTWTIACILTFLMNTYATVRVGVAGATGTPASSSSGCSARHPGADLVSAMGSVGSEPRRLPALKQIWDAPVTPLDLDALAGLDAVFLAMPDTLSAEVGPALAARGPKVFDLSGAFRLRDRGAASALVSALAGPGAAGHLRVDRA